jgi:transcriptional regulator GlxA family with amidase domain
VPPFTRAFRKATGSAYLPYLQRLRCDEAARLLRGSDLGLAEVASRCGFSSAHHLIRHFTRLYQATPGTYRRRHAGKEKRPKS